MKPIAWVVMTVLVTSLAAQAAPSSAVSTNVPLVIEQPPVAPDVVFPSPTVTTNKQGIQEFHFPMNPAITNMAAATNDLADLQSKLEAINKSIDVTNALGKAVRTDLRNDYRAVVGVMTNFVGRDEAGKKLHERILALETELKTLKAEFQKQLESDAEYKKARSKVEANRKQFEAVEKNMEALHQQRADMGAKVWQLKTMVERTRQEAEARAKEAEARKTSKPPAP